MKNVRFFFNRKDVLLFFMCVVVFAVLFVIVYDPIEAVGVADGMVGRWPEGVYLTFLVSVGFSLLGLSRAYLYYVSKSRRFSFVSYLVWVFCEIVVISFVLTVLGHQIRPESDVTFGRLFFRVMMDVLSILLIPYVLASLIVVLRTQRRKIEYLTELTMLQSQSVSESPKGGEDEVLGFYDKGGRFAFSTRRANVLYVESADNYCNIHYLNDGKVDRFILHNSMKNVAEAFSDKGFVRCHRCYMVNSHRIKSTMKTKDGLVIELLGSEGVIPVSKTYASEILSLSNKEAR